jgi:hypothetical protein
LEANTCHCQRTKSLHNKTSGIRLLYILESYKMSHLSPEVNPSNEKRTISDLPSYC